ncbi:MAG: transposase [Myxococcales bacterium]|nr:transposase [Myxococcales bacterium]
MKKATEVSSVAQRRRFSVNEKLRILREADACGKERGGVTALLRREGIYSSHLSMWRRQRLAGQFGAAPKKRGPVAVPPDARDKQIADLERRAARAEARADRAERLCALQKKVSELFGIPLPDPESEPKP